MDVCALGPTHSLGLFIEDASASKYPSRKTYEKDFKDGLFIQRSQKESQPGKKNKNRKLKEAYKENGL